MRQRNGFFTYMGCLAMACLLLTLPSLVFAGQYESLGPHLVDLKGWNADSVEGMDMDMGGTKIIQAMRRYTRDSQEADAMIMIGNTMMTQAQAQGMTSMQMETAEAKVKVTTIDGYQVSIHHSKPDAEGAIVVALPSIGQQGAIFVFHYKGLNEKEGLDTAKKFNWKKIEKQAQKLMQ